MNKIPENKTCTLRLFERIEIIHHTKDEFRRETIVPPFLLPGYGETDDKGKANIHHVNSGGFSEFEILPGISPAMDL